MEKNTRYKGSMDPEIIDLATPCSYERCLLTYDVPANFYEQRRDRLITVQQEPKKTA